ncbi:MAG: DNA-binding protein [Lachnospiraceae bacterium]|nr:DNA-binding protein [Lachnospiraceae bacterium]
MSKMQFYTADDVAEIMQISKPKAYEIIRELNGELEKMGYLTVRGRINSTFFHKKTDYQKEVVMDDAGF